MFFNGTIFYAILSYSYHENVKASCPRLSNYPSVGSSANNKFAIASIQTEMVAGLLARSLDMRRTINIRLYTTTKHEKKKTYRMYP